MRKPMLTKKEFNKNLSKQTFLWAVRITIQEIQIQVENGSVPRKKERTDLQWAKGHECSSHLGPLCETGI